MSHPSQQEFIRLTSLFFKLSALTDCKILEIGSYDVNGSVRSFLPQKNYIGVDLINGPGVDFVVNGEYLDFEDNSFDVVISCEVLEHNPFWEKQVLEMYRVLKNNGLMIITAASKGRLEHGTERVTPNSSPGSNSNGWNYYKNIFKKDMKMAIQNLSFNFKWIEYNRLSKDIYFIGKKGEKESKQVLLSEDFSKFIQPVFKIKPGNKSNKAKIVNFLMYPIFLSSNILSDKNFQNLAYFYQKILFKIIKITKKLLNLK